MSETPITDAVNKLRDTILAERDKGNIVFRGLPDQLMTAPLDEFVEQPAEGMLYDLNRLEEISLTFLKDPKWVNDFAVALVIRKLTDRLRQAEADLVKAREDAERYAMLFRPTWQNGKGVGVFSYTGYPASPRRISIQEANEHLDALSEEKGSFNSTYDEKRTTQRPI